MKRFVAFLFCLSAQILHAQFETGISSAELDSLIFSNNYKPNAPGCGVVIFKNDSIVYFGHKGVANVKEETPIGLHTPYNIGSITKMFTATAVLLLEEEGKLKRTDNIQHYIPELHVDESITINQLISHTSGIRSHFELAEFLFNFNKRLTRFPETIKYINNYPELQYQPGEQFAYSNSGYMLLAMIIERSSGVTYSEYLTENIFKPLGMENTYVSNGKVTYLNEGTAGYPINKKGKAKKPYKYSDALGATGVNSTLYDMYLWDKNFYNNKLGHQKNALIDTLTKSFVFNSGLPTNYGCGIILKNYRGKNAMEHSGGWGEYLTQYRRFPNDHISVIAWNNAANYSPFVTVDIACNAIFNFPADTVIPTQTPSNFDQSILTGIYLTANNYAREVKLKSDTLVLQLPLNQSNRFYPLKLTNILNDSIIEYIDTAGYTVTFQLNNGIATAMQWADGQYFVAERKYEKILEKTTWTNAELKGKYQLENKHNKVKISTSNKTNKLYMRVFPFFKFEMTNVAGNVYYLYNYEYYIHIDENKTLTMGDDWIFNLKYLKK